MALGMGLLVCVCFGILQTTSAHAGTSCLGLCTSFVASSGMKELSQQWTQPRCHEHPQQKQMFFWRFTSEWFKRNKSQTNLFLRRTSRCPPFLLVAAALGSVCSAAMVDELVDAARSTSGRFLPQDYRSAKVVRAQHFLSLAVSVRWMTNLRCEGVAAVGMCWSPRQSAETLGELNSRVDHFYERVCFVAIEINSESQN